MHLRGLLAGLAIVSLGVFAACGDDENEADDFRAAADQICVDRATALTEKISGVGPPTSIQEEAALVAELNPIREQSLEETQALEAPEDLADDWDEYVGLIDDLYQHDVEALQQLEDEDTDALTEGNAERAEINEQLDTVATDLDLTACAGVLSDEAQTEITSVIEEVMTTTDPDRVCGELVTENYLEGSGGEKACIASQKDPSATSDSAEVANITGVEDVTASAEVTQSGADAPEELNAELVYQDGAWKLDGLFQAPPEE